MNKYWSIIICTVWLLVFSLRAAPLEPGLVAQIHFAGGAVVSADTNSLALNRLWSTPEALALRAQTLDKLAKSMNPWLRQEIVPGLAAPVPLRPLLDDLCQFEWRLDLREPAANAVEFTLAVRLDKARAQAWQSALTPFLNAWKKSSPTHQAQIYRSTDWLLLEMGNASLPAPAGGIASLNKVWLTADVDWSRLARWFPAVAKFGLPATHLQAAGRGGEFQIDGKLFLSHPLPPLGKWQFPTNTIHSPFISFTAARGISDWLGQQPWVASLGINPLPDQVFAWALPQFPYQTFAASPLASAPAVLPKIDQSLSLKLHDSPHNSFSGGFSLIDTNDQLTLVGIPLMAPYVEALREASGEFLMAGFFPNFPRGKPAPPELMARMNRPNLVYYHWEVTSERMKLFPQLYQLMFVVTRHQQLEVNSAAGKWLAQVGPTLGPTVTQAFETTPSELTFSRKAPGGFTAVELVALCSWLEAPNFPGCDLRMPPPKIHHHAGPPPGGPAPFILHH